jgi:hypothetical protein
MNFPVTETAGWYTDNVGACLAGKPVRSWTNLQPAEYFRYCSMYPA